MIYNDIYIYNMRAFSLCEYLRHAEKKAKKTDQQGAFHSLCAAFLVVLIVCGQLPAADWTWDTGHPWDTI